MPKIIIDNGFVEYTYAWCETCDDIVEIEWSFLPANKLNDHDAFEMSCAICKYIIATIHERPSPPVHWRKSHKSRIS